jgi:HD-GYP domain-containing protein (c-di-GMP phosphodiesterase class II)
MVICLALSARFRRLAVMADNSTVLGLAFGLVLIGSAPMVFVVGEPYGAGFWLAHLLDIIGVTAVSVLALIGYRRGRTMHALLAPIDAVTPLQAVEIGLDPLVHEWVAAIDAKDAQTRDHVVRTSRLAVQTASKMGLSPTQIRRTGIGAILHDVGKLDIPDDILTKPGRLTDDERAIMQTHAARGAAKLAVSPVLGDAAPIVAAHHERIDGRGYPMGLAGDRIPIEARVIAACDAYDAITNNRHYRRKMSHDRAEAILREHAGSQWDGDVVEALLAVVRSERVTTRPVGLESVGRNGRFETPAPACVCHDAVPEVVAAE